MGRGRLVDLLKLVGGGRLSLNISGRWEDVLKNRWEVGGCPQK